MTSAAVGRCFLPRLARVIVAVACLRAAAAVGADDACRSAVTGPTGAARPAKGRFLVASRSLSDPNFAHSVVLLLVYEKGGSMGVIINRPSHLPLSTALPEIEELRRCHDPVYFGGPVALNGALMLVRSPKRPQGAQTIFKDVHISGSRAALRQALRASGKTNRLRVYAGHAGWGAGQLDEEVARGDWLVAEADAASIFDVTAADVWPRFIERVSGQWTRAESDPRPGRGQAVVAGLQPAPL